MVAATTDEDWMYSKFTSGSVLENPLRETIYMILSIDAHSMMISRCAVVARNHDL